MPITRHGIREIIFCTLLFGGGAALCAWTALHGYPLLWVPAVPLALIWLFTIAFFRDPDRTIPDGPGLMVAPADGKVTEVTHLDDYEGIDRPAIKISIFLSVFDVHINRAPCAGRVLRTDYRAGDFLDARHPECGIRNESNTITIEPTDGLIGPVIVRQVSGLIARRIVCAVKPGDVLQRGQRLGLIKFGSRTDVIVPADNGLEPAVQVNDMVKGGSTVLLRRAMVPARTNPQPSTEPLSAAHAHA